MIGMNIMTLRKAHNLTQEELAEQLLVSRQTLAKWERGEGEPDISSCKRMAEIFQVSLDDLVNFKEEDEEIKIGVPPKGKYFFGSVTVGERGQIVIPQKARKVFHIEPGDQILVFGDEERGMGLMPKQGLLEVFNMMWSDKKDKKSK
ncbi:MAG: helix-turn-helix domain-containing protein [Lachnospiraceae bacterium]|nr:helix-turn-helix domain-containing protein [Lachnospiraceae bacterium]